MIKNFQKVKVLDVHSNVSLALLNNVEQLPIEPHITAALTKVYGDCGDTPVFYFPDEGAMKRYSEHVPGPYAFGIKKRDWETGEIKGLDVSGMTDLIRPALYQAYHKVENISSDDAEELYDVVGPICESSDVFVKDHSMNKTKRGDLLALRSAGAYGEIMASRYNLRAIPQGYLSTEL